MSQKCQRGIDRWIGGPGKGISICISLYIRYDTSSFPVGVRMGGVESLLRDPYIRVVGKGVAVQCFNMSRCGLAHDLGALSLTYVEMNLKAGSPALYPIMFGAVFLMNAFFAYDGYTEAKAVSGK
jgi:hypothetical protein